MTTTGQFLNSPLRNCATCFHRNADRILGEDWDSCRRWRGSCHFAVRNEHLCGLGLREWKAIPPRRSLRQWLYDMLWK